MDGREQPLVVRISSVGSLFSINLQTSRDFEGGKSFDQMVFVQ